MRVQAAVAAVALVITLQVADRSKIGVDHGPTVSESRDPGPFCIMGVLPISEMNTAMRVVGALLVATSAAVPAGGHARPTSAAVRVFAAGSLTAPLTVIAAAITREQGIDLEFTFGRRVSDLWLPRLISQGFDRLRIVLGRKSHE
jgi:hypothetical protein